MIPVVLVDEERYLGELASEALEDEEGFEVLRVLTSSQEALDFLESHDNSEVVAVVSSSLPGKGASEFVRACHKKDLPARILVTGVPDNEEQILQYLQVGAEGYVLREDSFDELVDQIRAVHQGEFHLDPEVAGVLIQRVSELTDLCDEHELGVDKMNYLTPRERQVLTMLEENLSNGYIAECLSIQEGTVKNHVHNILKKLKVGRREDAAAIYRRFLWKMKQEEMEES